MTIEDKTIVIIKYQGFTVMTQKEEFENFSYTIHFGRINYICYDLIGNILSVDLIGGKRVFVPEVDQEGYGGIAGAYAAWSAQS